jgi:hypothetical protein
MGTPDPGEGQIVENAIDLVGNEPLFFGAGGLWSFVMTVLADRLLPAASDAALRERTKLWWLAGFVSLPR